VGGFQLRENSASALGSAYAGAAASAEDPSIIANNPAGMIDLSGSQVSGDISLVIPSVVFSGIGFTALAQPIAGGNGGDAGSAQPLPAVYGFYDAAPDLKFGLAVTAPFGLNTQYDSNSVGRFQAIKSDLETININPNFAYRISDWLSFGAGFAIQHLQTELTNAVNSTAVARLANPLLLAGFALPDGSVRVTGDSLSVGYTLGILAEILPPPLAVNPRFQNTPARADLSTPDIVTLAASHEISPEVALLAELQWTNWSVVKNLRIDIGSRWVSAMVGRHISVSTPHLPMSSSGRRRSTKWRQLAMFWSAATRTMQTSSRCPPLSAFDD